MFFGTNDIQASGIEVFKLMRQPYRGAASLRPFHAISFRIYGEAKYETDQQTFTTKTGDILFVPAYAPYIKETRAEQFYVVHFNSDEPLGDQLLCMTPKDPEKYRMLFEQLYATQSRKGIGYTHEVKQLFYRLIGDMEKEYALQDNSPVEYAMNKALRIIHERYMEPDFSVGTLPVQLNMSETYFRRQFQRIKGTSPKKYVSALKVEMAKELLRSGYYSVGEVASRCGFASAYYFSAFMKQETGKSPREWIGVPARSKNEK